MQQSTRRVINMVISEKAGLMLFIATMASIVLALGIIISFGDIGMITLMLALMAVIGVVAFKVAGWMA